MNKTTWGRGESMRKTFLLFLVVIAFASVVYAQPKTVTDYYLALPGGVNGIEGVSDGSGFKEDFFFYSNERNESKTAIIKYRKSLIKIEDIANGYLRLESVEWEGWVEIALFKKADGEYIVAVSQVGCGPSCSGDVMFLTYKSGRWANVTKSVFPSKPSSDIGYFKLPRFGTTVELVCGVDGDEDCKDGEILSEVKWNKTKFVSKGGK
jgi:hypothetical protein